MTLLLFIIKSKKQKYYTLHMTDTAKDKLNLYTVYLFVDCR